MEKSIFFYFANFSESKYSVINVAVSGAGFLKSLEPKLTTVQTSIFQKESLAIYVLLSTKLVKSQYKDQLTINLTFVSETPLISHQ